MDYRLAHVPYQARQASRGIQFVEDIYPELVMKRILRVNFLFLSSFRQTPSRPS